MTLHRAAVSEDARKKATELFSHHVIQHMHAELARHRHLTDQLVRANAPAAAAIRSDAAAIAALHAMTPQLEAERKRFEALGKAKTVIRPRTFSITVNSGLNISVPPYDTEWTSSIVDQADRNAGTFSCVSIDTLGFEGAGLGVFLSSQIETEVRFSADARFDTSWANWVIEPGGVTTTAGVVGVLIYENGSVLYDERATLWYNFQSTPGQPASSQDSIFLTQTPIGQSYFLMRPGSTYQVWVWCYTITTLAGSGLSTGVIQAQMPFVVVEQLG